MAYIVVLNPLILGGGADRSGAHLPQTQVAAATALVAYTFAPEMTWTDAGSVAGWSRMC